MKLAQYTLNADGSVPEFVIDGGYFAQPDDGLSPQDFMIVGWVTDDADVPVVSDLEALLISLGADSWTDQDGEPYDIPAAIAFINSLAS